jgi:hypothetical protein
VATHLVELVGQGGYYSGTIEFEFEELFCQMTLSAVVYHQSQPDVGYTHCAVADMIPVWWEFHTYRDEEELLNDFSFNELRCYIQSLV